MLPKSVNGEDPVGKEWKFSLAMLIWANKKDINWQYFQTVKA